MVDSSKPAEKEFKKNAKDETETVGMLNIKGLVKQRLINFLS